MYRHVVHTYVFCTLVIFSPFFGKSYQEKSGNPAVEGHLHLYLHFWEPRAVKLKMKGVKKSKRRKSNFLVWSMLWSNFLLFSPILGEIQWRYLYKNPCYDPMFAKTSSILYKTRQLYAKFFDENIFKVTASVHDWVKFYHTSIFCEKILGYLFHLFLYINISRWCYYNNFYQS
jgi:hypothetical protein